ncbi:hypothetical protein ACTA71_001943 [Dictyostelium dimigraforme]
MNNKIMNPICSKLSSQAAVKQFIKLKRLGGVCLGLVRAGLYEDSTNINTQEVYDYVDTILQKRSTISRRKTTSTYLSLGKIEKTIASRKKTTKETIKKGKTRKRTTTITRIIQSSNPIQDHKFQSTGFDNTQSELIHYQNQSILKENIIHSRTENVETETMGKYAVEEQILDDSFELDSGESNKTLKGTMRDKPTLKTTPGSRKV